ncbi:MAG: hypothetical protein M0Z66_05570 [Thermaerobacter sp.]|nr:hypothetical protein [Thermaerobacter sp.]
MYQRVVAAALLATLLSSQAPVAAMAATGYCSACLSPSFAAGRRAAVQFRGADAASPPTLRSAGAQTPGFSRLAFFPKRLPSSATYAASWAYPKEPAINNTAVLPTWLTYTVSISLTVADGVSLSQASSYSIRPTRRWW